MDEEYEFEECDGLEAEYEHPVRRFRKGDLIVLALDTAYGVAATFANSLAMARNLAGMHMNYRVDQDNFHRDAMLEIETITGEQE